MKLPFSRGNVDHSLLDADHDLDLVVLVNEARTPAEIHQIERMSSARLRARRREGLSAGKRSVLRRGAPERRAKTL